MNRIQLLAVLAVLAWPGAAQATTFIEDKFVCPVGGEKFKAAVVASYSSWGQRPDGRAYGTLPIPPIVECPGNGLLLIEESFTPTELAILNEAVPSPEYQGMRTTETPRYRAWWLLTKLGRDPYQTAGQLLMASWESDGNWDRKVRYLAAYVAAATGLKRDAEHAGPWLWLNLRAANALRELGYFDKALALLERLDRPEYLPSDPEQLAGANELIAGLRQLAQEQNLANEPANLIPDRYAGLRCEMAVPPLTAVEVAVCDKPEMAEFRKAARKLLDRAGPGRVS